MKIFIDTNILISGFVFKGTVLRLLLELFDTDHELLISDYVDAEFRSKLSLKWPERASSLYENLHQMKFIFCPSSPEPLGTLRDEKDIPVLSDAIFNNADIILTGDKDFLESNISHPRICSPADLAAFLAE